MEKEKGKEKEKAKLVELVGKGFNTPKETM